MASWGCRKTSCGPIPWELWLSSQAWWKPSPLLPTPSHPQEKAHIQKWKDKQGRGPAAIELNGEHGMASGGGGNDQFELKILPLCNTRLND